MLQPEDSDTQEGKTPLEPLSSFDGTLANRVYLSLKSAIMALSYTPGAMLRKVEICETLGVSRSPVSEAMARLAAEGLVNVVPQAGTYVARFSLEEIREGAFLREALEVAAIEDLAGRITEPQLVQLRRNLRVQAALVEDGDNPGFYQMDSAMHELILNFTGHKRLAQIAESAWVQVNRARQLILPEPGRVEATLNEHLAILAALEARDGEAARQATRHHLRQLITYIEPLEASRPELFET